MEAASYCKESFVGAAGRTHNILIEVTLTDALNIITVIHSSSIPYLFKCVWNIQKANYEVSIGQIEKQTDEGKQKTKQGNLYHLDNNNSISAITSTIRRRGNNIYL
jgi:hypothetical protein